MVYADDHDAIFLHSSVAPQLPAIARPQPGADYPAVDPLTFEATVRAAAQLESIGLLQWLRGRPAWPMREMSRSSFFLQTGEIDACMGVSLDAIRRTPFLVPDLMLNLGHAFNARGRRELSNLCFDAFLRVDDDPVIAADIRRIRAQR